LVELLGIVAFLAFKGGSRIIIVNASLFLSSISMAVIRSGISGAASEVGSGV
jgi:hypothetical protein